MTTVSPWTPAALARWHRYFPDRIAVTYDPRGLGRSTRRDGLIDHSPTVQANDVHAVIEALGAGPVEMFASSGGVVTALALVATYPDDVATLVAHEPPLIPVLIANVRFVASGLSTGVCLPYAKDWRSSAAQGFGVSRAAQFCFMPVGEDRCATRS